jgi:hypothetical protein
MGESILGLLACEKAGQLSEPDFQGLDELAYHLENPLLRLVASLEKKRTSGDWAETIPYSPDQPASE